MPSPQNPLPTAIPASYPPHRAISARQARDLDRVASEEFGIPSIVLMEHASRGVAGAVQAAAPRGPVLVLCGPGNNGGDGYGVARFLASWGRPVRVCRLAPSPPAGGDSGLEAALVAQELDVAPPPADLGALIAATAPALIVDALFGVGLSRPLGSPWDGWIRAINAATCPRLSIDVPSGMETDTGDAMPVCVQADVTATMVAPKLGFDRNPTPAGHVIEIDIGLPGSLHGRYLA